MKKLLVAVLAMASVSAFSQSHMVRFSDFSDTQNGGVNLSFNTEDDDATGKSSQTSIALNYAYTVAPQVQIGLGVNYENGSTTKAMYYTVSGYYNFSTDLANAYYAGLHYLFGEDKVIATGDTDDKDTVIAAEFGKRFAIGSWAGFNLTFAPSVMLAMSTTENDASGNETKSTDLTWNFFKFDVLF